MCDVLSIALTTQSLCPLGEMNRSDNTMPPTFYPSHNAPVQLSLQTYMPHYSHSVTKSAKGNRSCRQWCCLTAVLTSYGLQSFTRLHCVSATGHTTATLCHMTTQLHLPSFLPCLLHPSRIKGSPQNLMGFQKMYIICEMKAVNWNIVFSNIT